MRKQPAQERISMKLKSDFVGDWLNILKDILENCWDYDTSGLTKEELPFFYFNAARRRPDSRPRIVKLADTFSCDAGLQDGWTRLRNRVESGADITANLSKLVTELHKKDPMLNDWGIHHFHLSEKMEGKFVKRDGPLLFALVTKEHFLAIGVYPHGAWARSDIVETIHRNWPEAVSHHKIFDVMPDTAITEKERLILRKRNANSFVLVGDGTVYAPIGGGTVASGDNILDVIRTDKEISNIKVLENYIQSELGNFVKELIQHGYSGEQEIEANLEITNNDYLVIFPKFNYVVAVERIS